MASFDEHIAQAKKNLKFLESVNNNVDDHWDWKVTICFYVSVHLINAHLSKFGLHYRTHKKVEDAINPFKKTSPTKVDEELYLKYLKLRNLSRRSRYLCHDKPENQSTIAFLTYDKHYSKAIRNLEGIIGFVSSKYSVTFNPISVKCVELKNLKSEFFKVSA